MGTPLESARRNREYLRSLGASGSKVMSVNETQVGIIGAGRIGRVHADTIAHRVPEATAGRRSRT